MVVLSSFMFAARRYLSILIQRLAKGVQCTGLTSISASFPKKQRKRICCTCMCDHWKNYLMMQASRVTVQYQLETTH